MNTKNKEIYPKPALTGAENFLRLDSLDCGSRILVVTDAQVYVRPEIQVSIDGDMDATSRAKQERAE